MSEYENNGNERILYIPQTPGLKPHYQLQFSVIPRYVVKYCYLTLRVPFNINLFADSLKDLKYCYLGAIDPQPPPSSIYKIK